jgi:hypothetical protein
MKLLPTLGSSMSGSLRGLTASHNKGGLYLRGRTIPTNPNTGRQQDMRSIVGGLSQEWTSSLTEAQRQAWRDYAANVPVTDKLGQSMLLSGINWWIKSRSAAFQVLGSTLTGATTIGGVDAPTMYNTGQSVNDVSTFEGDFTTPPGTVTIGGGLTGETTEDATVAIYIGSPQNAGVRFYKGPYQLAGLAATTSGAFSYTTGALDLGAATDWVADTIPVASWDGLYVPLMLVVLYDDHRRSQVFKMLIQFTDATP